jgi:thiol-disulfide isomerase/thioredoxin
MIVHSRLLFCGLFLLATRLVAVPELSGRDLLSGKNITFFESSKLATAVVFLSSRCPCSRSHEAVLKELAKKYPEVRFVGVHSNQNEPNEEAKRYFEKAALPFPVIEDTGAKLADKLSAFKTPHIFVLDPGGNKLFSGGVDDSHLAQNAKKQYLAAALKAISENKKPDPAEVRTLGCIIQR